MGGSSSEGISYNYVASIEKISKDFVTLSVHLTVGRTGEPEFKLDEKLQRGREIERRTDRSSHRIRISRRMDSKSFDLHKPVTRERGPDEDASRLLARAYSTEYGIGKGAWNCACYLSW